MPKKTIEEAKKKECEMLVQIKGNQKDLMESCKITEKYISVGDSFKTKEKAHGRIERRKTEVFKNIQHVTKQTRLKWEDLKTLIKITRERTIRKKQRWVKEKSTAFYATTLEKVSAEKASELVRGHWGIENSNHYVRDEILGEDKSRIRIKPVIMATCRSFALNILRDQGVSNIKRTCRNNCFDLDSLLELALTF